MSERWFSLVELLLVFGLVLVWALWQVYDWRRWRRQQRDQKPSPPHSDEEPR